LLRILLRDVLGAANLSNVTEELSNLADAILDVAYRRIRSELVARHGEPRLEDGTLCGFSVVSLGKLGGKELNYSSDIDLMFVYGGNGETDGPSVLTNKEFYKKVANQYTSYFPLTPRRASVTAWTCACGRMDSGRDRVSEEGARTYYSDARARLGEADVDQGAPLRRRERTRRAAAGVCRTVDLPKLRSTFRAVEAVSETRQRISEKLAAKRGAPAGSTSS
jgi:glutamate-ammonia-ligase adenylyltransferase